MVGKCSKDDAAVCTIKAAGNKLKAKVAYSKEAQSKGLMWVTELKDGEGMIFVYDVPEQLSFWMKNTLIPLSIAFVESNGRISAIYEMSPELGTPDFALKTYQTPTPVNYAIEAPAGWFASKNIKVSDYIDIPAELK